MFLDDQLYEKVKQTKIDKPEDFQTLVNNLYRICEDYFQPKLSEVVGCSYREVTQIMDKTFKLWDMFIAKLDKEDWFLIDVLKDHSYKGAFMNNEKLKEIYDLGK